MLSKSRLNELHTKYFEEMFRRRLQIGLTTQPHNQKEKSLLSSFTITLHFC